MINKKERVILGLMVKWGRGILIASLILFSVLVIYEGFKKLQKRSDAVRQQNIETIRR
jgi:hypothetical protein